MLERDFNEFTYKRCEEALTGDKVYIELQRKCIDVMKEKNIALYEELTCQLEARVEEICYMKGFQDALAILSKK